MHRKIYQDNLCNYKNIIEIKKREENISWGKRLAQSRQNSNQIRKKPQLKLTKAGLILPVNSILNQLKKALPKYIIQQKSAVLMTGVIEYLVT